MEFKLPTQLGSKCSVRRFEHVGNALAPQVGSVQERVALLWTRAKPERKRTQLRGIVQQRLHLGRQVGTDVEVPDAAVGNCAVANGARAR